MPRLKETSPIHEEQTIGDHLRVIKEFFDDISFETGEGYTLEEIWEKSGSRLTLDSLRSYILNWERSEQIHFRDTLGAQWNIVRHREHAKASLKRLSVISLDNSLRIFSETDEVDIKFFDEPVETSNSITSQLLTRGTGWNYFDYIDSLGQFCHDEDKSKEDQLVTAVNKYSTKEIQKVFKENKQEPIILARRGILISGVRIYYLLASYGLLSADGTVISKDSRITIDQRWFALMPYFHKLIAYCQSQQFSPEFLEQALQVCSILFTVQVDIDQYEDVPNPQWETDIYERSEPLDRLRYVVEFSE